MSPARFALAALVLAATAAGPARAADTEGPHGLSLGAPAPMREASLKNIDGTNVSIATAAGKKGTLVVFICNHCPWVKKWQGRIAAVGNDAVKRGVGVLAVNSNDPAAYPEDSFEEMQARAKSVGYRFPYAMDETSELARAFGAVRTPEAFLFDVEGKLVYHGAVDDNANDPKGVKDAWLREAIEALAAGKAVPVAETKALGCGIKLREKSSS